VSPCFAGVS